MAGLVDRANCILLDRDGTINRERADYVKSWEEFEWLPGALAALHDLAQLPVPIAVVSNQSALGRGIITQAELDAIHGRMLAEVAAAGGRIDAIFVCPHTPDAGCDCRKPRPGLLFQAARTFAIDLADSIFVGDAVTDWEAARAAGCGCILVRTGRQGSTIDARMGEVLIPQIVDDLTAAVALIVADRALQVDEIDR